MSWRLLTLQLQSLLPHTGSNTSNNTKINFSMLRIFSKIIERKLMNNKIENIIIIIWEKVSH